MRDDIDLAHFKQLLEQRLAEIVAGRKPVKPVELDQARVGRLSRMDAMQQQEMAQAAARLSTIEAGRIKSALNRLADGEYGYCLECGEEIAEGRLRVDPSVLTCIDCARAAATRGRKN